MKELIAVVAVIVLGVAVGTAIIGFNDQVKAAAEKVPDTTEIGDILSTDGD